MRAKNPSRSDLMLSSVTAYYKNKSSHRKTIHEIINGTSPLSLRLIDWFLTHYSKDACTSYWNDDKTHELIETLGPDQTSENLTKFNLHMEYRAQLQSYTKMFFDPFRRYERISFVLETSPTLVSIETTVGQLNFFRWALENNVLEYITKHLADIEDCMASFQKSGKSDTNTKETKKKKQPIIAHTISHSPTYIRFD